MGDLLTLVKMMLFGSSTLLTNVPIDIGNEDTGVNLKESLDVVTSGAHLELDITSYITSDDLMEKFNQIEQFYPKGCVVAEMETQDSLNVEFSDSVGAVGDEDIVLKLFSKKQLSEDKEFISLKIRSCREISITTVTWSNWSK